MRERPSGLITAHAHTIFTDLGSGASNFSGFFIGLFALSSDIRFVILFFRSMPTASIIYVLSA